jgi:hypothetical protein
MPKEYVILTKRQERLARKLVKAKDRGDIVVTDALIAGLFGCSASKISQVRTGRITKAPTAKTKVSRKKLPEKVQKKIEKLVGKGKSIREIQLGAKVSYATAQRYRQRQLQASLTPNTKIRGGSAESGGVGN